jgi:hypothetical protein
MKFSGEAFECRDVINLASAARLYVCIFALEA